MDVFALAAHLTALILLALLTFRLWRNLRFLRGVQNLNSPLRDFPLVSILVPARNEARAIAACIESLAGQNYRNFEIIALNDQSSDETGLLLDKLVAKVPNLTVLHGSEAPPTGWNGKSYACQRLAEAATGDWLLFTDADTVHAPNSIGQGISQMRALNVSLLSAMPKQVTKRWSEQVLVSFILDFLPLLALDLPGLPLDVSSSVAANGQYLLVHAASYRALGGHEAIFDALVDDFALARLFRENRHPIALVSGVHMLACRMYHTAGEVWQGFSKNILLGLEASSAKKHLAGWALAFTWGYACLFVLPFYHVLLPDQRLWALLEIGWLALLRGMINRQLERPLSEILTTPLAAWSVMALGLNALRRRMRRGQVRWKGREYGLMH